MTPDGDPNQGYPLFLIRRGWPPFVPHGTQVPVTSDGYPRRLSQLAAEIAVAATSANARVSQLPAEIVVGATSAQARVSQLAVEIVVKPTGPARVSQLAVEVVARVPHTRVEVVWVDG